MTTKQGVTIASRILTIYFLTLAGYRLTDLPAAWMAFSHYWKYQEALPDRYYYRLQIESLAHSTLIIAIDLAMALVFFRCGAKVESFLSGGTATEPNQIAD